MGLFPFYLIDPKRNYEYYQVQLSRGPNNQEPKSRLIQLVRTLVPNGDASIHCFMDTDFKMVFQVASAMTVKKMYRLVETVILPEWIAYVEPLKNQNDFNTCIQQDEQWRVSLPPVPHQ